MSDPSDPGSPGGGDGPRECAEEIAEEIARLMKVARSQRFDFLAYLLAMALKESRRLSRTEH